MRLTVPTSCPRCNGLTKTESRSLKLINKGLSWREIALKIGISHGYARVVGVNIRKKTGIGMKEIQSRASST
jgi:DNA-binding CsgD family transcriptional regulator